MVRNQPGKPIVHNKPRKAIVCNALHIREWGAWPITGNVTVAGIALGVILAALLGCEPREPFYLRHVDRDLSHYNAVANEIEYPDVEADRLADVSGANRPFSLTNTDPKEIWNLTLEEAMQIALTNNKVMRTIGGQVQGPPEFMLA